MFKNAINISKQPTYLLYKFKLNKIIVVLKILRCFLADNT